MKSRREETKKKGAFKSRWCVVGLAGNSKKAAGIYGHFYAFDKPPKQGTPPDLKSAATTLDITAQGQAGLETKVRACRDKRRPGRPDRLLRWQRERETPRD